MAMADRRKEMAVFLVLKKNNAKYWSEHQIGVRVSKRRPTRVGPDEVVVKLRLNIDLAMWDPPTASAVVTVDPSHLIAQKRVDAECVAANQGGG